MPIDQTCPDVSHWQRLLSESASSDEQQMLEQHLNGCLRCQGMVEALAVGAPHWSAAVRQLAGAAIENEPELDRALNRLKKGGLGLTQRMNEAADDIPLSFLASPKKPGYIGEMGQYSVAEVLGSGGMGIVLKAFDNVLHRHVALKVLATPLASQKLHRQRFLREARAAAAVVHEHVVTIHAVDEGDPYPYIVMQYVRGCSLQERVTNGGALELKEVLRIGMQIASGLAAAHAQGLIHRDVKPANVLLENGVERVKITDFGLARTIDDVGLTQSGVVSGTPQYMAPEQARGEPLDHRADLFSLGSVLYFACTGKVPFQGHTLMGIMRSVADDQPIPLARLNPDVPPWLVAIIARLHAKSPADRYQSAAEVADILGARLARLQNPVGTVTPAEMTVVDTQTILRGKEAHERDRRRKAAAALLFFSVAALAAAEAAGITHVRDYFRSGSNATAASSAPGPIDSSRGSAPPAPGSTSPRVGAVAPPKVASARVTLRDVNGMETGEIGSFAEKATRLAAAALSPDGTRALAAGGSDTDLLLWDVKAGKVIRRLAGHESWIRRLAFSADGRRAVSGGGGSWQVVNGQRPGGNDFSVRIWDLDTGKELQKLPGHAGTITGVAFTPDGTRVLSCGRDTVVRLWSIDTGEELRQYDGHRSEALCLAVSSDGKYVAAGGWSVVLVWDIESGELLKTLKGHYGNVVSAAFSPDDRLLVTGGHDGTIRLYSVESAGEVRQFTGHSGRVLAVAFSPDGRRLLSGGDDKTVRLWNVSSAAELQSYAGHAQSVNDVAFGPNDSRLAVSAGEDGTMRLWLLPSPSPD